MDDVRTPRIIVGVNGSMASVRALRWAARVAGLVDGQLRVVLAWRPERFAIYAPGGRLTPEEQRSQATERLNAAMRAVFSQEPSGEVVAEIVTGTAELALIDRSAGADLLVIGSASAPGIHGHLVGPVIRACISRARCPVVVIGPQDATGNPDPCGAHGDSGKALATTLALAYPG